MEDFTLTPPQFRHELETARVLAAHRVGFVVVPVVSAEEFERLSLLALQKLEEIAALAEKEHALG